MLYELPRLLNWDVLRSLNYDKQKRKPAPLKLKLDLAVMPKVIKYFAPAIIPSFWTLEIGLMSVFWTNTVTKASVQLPLPLYMGYWDFWMGMLSLNWLLFKKGKPVPLLLHLCFRVKLHWNYRPGVWMRCSCVVIESLCFNWTTYFIQPSFKHF